MSAPTTPGSRGGGSSPALSTVRRNLEHPAHRRLQSEAASSRYSSPSPSSERSARYRSTSLAPSSVRKKELLDRKWREISERCLTRWEMLEQKYAHITAEEDDIVDIATLQIVVDRGVMRSKGDSVFGENLSDEEQSVSSRYPSDEDEIGGWDDVSRSGDEAEAALDESESEEERERHMTEDDRWDLAEFMRKNAMLPNPDVDEEEEEEDDHGYPEVEIPGEQEEYYADDGPDRSESPDEEELQQRRNHRSGSMVWDSQEALFSDGVDMENEDELAAADSDLEEATKRTPVSKRVQLSPDTDSETDIQPGNLHSLHRVRSEERERISASAGPSRARTPFAQTSRIPSQPTPRTSTTSIRKAAPQKSLLSTESGDDSEEPLFESTARPAPPASISGPKKRGRPRKHPLPVDRAISEDDARRSVGGHTHSRPSSLPSAESGDDSEGPLFKNPARPPPPASISEAKKRGRPRKHPLPVDRAISEDARRPVNLHPQAKTSIASNPTSEPKKRGRPKGSKNRPRDSLTLPASEPIVRTASAFPKSRSAPSLNVETPTESMRRAQAYRVRDSDARSELHPGAMSLVTLDDLFSPPPESSPAMVRQMLFDHSPDAPRAQARPTVPAMSRGPEKPSAGRQPNALPKSRSITSATPSADQITHRRPAQGSAGPLDPVYYHSSPHPTRGHGVKHCKACRAAGGTRAQLSELCRGRMGVSRCKFEFDREHDSTFVSAATITAPQGQIPNSAVGQKEALQARPRPKQVQAISRVRMSLGSEADDESSPSVHQRKLLKKRSAPPSSVSRAPAAVASSRLEARLSDDDMPIDPDLLALDAPVTDTTSPSDAEKDRRNGSDDSRKTPTRKGPREPSIFREPAPSSSARGYTRPRVAHIEAPEPPVRDGYAPNLYYRPSGSYRLCSLCRRAGGEREKYAMYCPGRTQAIKFCSFEGIAPPKARAATSAPTRDFGAETPGKRRYIPRNTPAPTPGPAAEDEELGRGSRKRKRVNYTEEPLEGDYGVVEKENIPPHTYLSQSHLPTPSPSISAPEGSTSISPSSAYRLLETTVSNRRVASLAEARPTSPPVPHAARGSSEALGWSWNRGSTPNRSILRRPSESSATASEEPRSAKRIRFSQAPRSPSNGYSPAARLSEPEREASEDELLLHDNSSPPGEEVPRRRETNPDSPPISREWRIRAMDAGIRVQHHTGRLPSTLLKNIGPVQPNASFVPGSSTARPSLPGLKATNPHIAALMLPPPLPSRGTPSRIGLSPLSRELHLTKTPAGQSTHGEARRAVSTLPVQRVAEQSAVRRHWSTAPRRTAAEKDPDWIPGDSD